MKKNQLYEFSLWYTGAQVKSLLGRKRRETTWNKYATRKVLLHSLLSLIHELHIFFQWKMYVQVRLNENVMYAQLLRSEWLMQDMEMWVCSLKSIRIYVLCSINLLIQNNQLIQSLSSLCLCTGMLCKLVAFSYFFYHSSFAF